MQSENKTILDFQGNSNRVNFDINTFISCKRAINESKKIIYRDKLELLLVNYHDGHLHYDEHIHIDLEKNLDNHYASIRTLMEFFTEEYRYESTAIGVASLL